ncbi:MAG TPA: hypothetical protein VF384_15275 [Planctomycetota bacterium]
MRRGSPTRLCSLAALVATASSGAAQDAAARTGLELAVRQYLTSEGPASAQLQAVLGLARGHDDLLAEIVRTKSYLTPVAEVALRGVIDGEHRFVEDGTASNPAWFHGPATGQRLFPLAVYVPDSTDTGGFGSILATDATAQGWYVFLVPDEKRDNLWKATIHEHQRHVGPLRDLLLRYPIDPDRVFFVGSGRGGHATWDVGLMHAGRFAALVPCNGGVIHEGGWKSTGGVFLENAKNLAVFTVYNTTFDHGIESCRYAARRFQEWGYRFEAKEEPRMRLMGLPEAFGKVDGVVRNAHPRQIQKRFNHVGDGGHYWLKALDRSPREWDPAAQITIRGTWPAERNKQLELVWDQVRKECALVKGTIAGNQIEITAHGMSRLRVYFDPEIVDLGAKVTVVVNGKARKPVTLTKQPAVMLQHVRETGDTSRLYWAFEDCPVPK